MVLNTQETYQALLTRACAETLTATVGLHAADKIDGEGMRDAITRNLALTRQLFAACGACPTNSWDDFLSQGLTLAESLSGRARRVMKIMEEE